MLRSDLNKTQAQYVRYDTFKLLQDKVDSFANIDHIRKLKTVFLPKFEEFSNHIDHYTEKIYKMEISVESIDEAMSIKANKSQLTILESKVRKDLVSKSDLEKEHQKFVDVLPLLQDKLNSVKLRFEEAQDRLSQEVLDISQKALNERFLKYEKVYEGFRKFFSSENLQS